MSIHWNTSPASSGRKPSSLSELEGRDATRVGGNFPTEAFFSVENIFSNYTESFRECKNCTRYTLGVFGFFPENPMLQGLQFLASVNSLFFSWRETLSGNPQTFQEKHYNWSFLNAYKNFGSEKKKFQPPSVVFSVVLHVNWHLN